MRIVFDLQGAQSESRYRGIGRYSLALTRAIAQAGTHHDIHIALNGLLADSVEPLCAQFDGLVPRQNIHVWQAPGPVAELDAASAWRRQAAERLRETFLASLRPDIVHVTSLFEGLVDDAVTSIGTAEPALLTSITLHDLIPLVHRQTYLADPLVESFYERKLGHMRRATLWLANSEASRRESIEWLGLPADRVVNVSTAADAQFRPLAVSDEHAAAVRQRCGLRRPFLMYTGGGDSRKNLDALLRAYGSLPQPVRAGYQLALVGKLPADVCDRLRRTAAAAGLGKDEVVLTGYVDDADLVALYNLCWAFVFPSIHEGFGLPALEAMACGVAVLGSNTSSLPEVIGRADAMFDPHDEASMARRIGQVLTDGAFRAALQRHGPVQARKFSWDASARRALDAFERCRPAPSIPSRPVAGARAPARRPRLAYVSPLPPERTGIANYSAELIPELARHYDIDVVVSQITVDDAWVRANCRVRSPGWFDRHAHRFDRILYQVGNSPFHQHMLDLMERHPGTVVLHDFFLSALLADMEIRQALPGTWTAALQASHGYGAVAERAAGGDLAALKERYPVNFSVLQAANGVIVHSLHSCELADAWYGPGFSRDWKALPHLRSPARGADRAAARQALGLAEADFLVCSFGHLDPSKLNHRLLDAWLASSLGADAGARLVFVGQNHGGPYGAGLEETIAASGARGRIRITGYASPDDYRRHLAAADAAVQLRTASRGETSGAVLDCMNFGLATIVNANGAMAELPGDCVVRLPDAFDAPQLVQALEWLRNRPAERAALGARGQAHLHARHAPREVADRYAEAIEHFAHSGPDAWRARAIEAVAAIEAPPADPACLLSCAEAIAWNTASARPAPRQLLLDVSNIVRNDLKTGIERVVRNIAARLLQRAPEGFRVEPVYANDAGSYSYARSYALGLLGAENPGLADEPIDVRRGDVFVGLDLAQQDFVRQRPFLQRLRQQGCALHVVVYDLLPLKLPGYFPDWAQGVFGEWLHTAVQLADGAVCISRAVADELADWLDAQTPKRSGPLHIGWMHLGSELDRLPAPADRPAQSEPAGAPPLPAHPAVLMVGTIEPRKGHAQALAAFELLWAAGEQVSLVIVGKQGWMVDALAERLRGHPERGRRLHWFEGLDDRAVDALYAAAAGLLVASEGEGFGLPLTEAAHRGCPLLARDLPVFREVAGPCARYFRGDAPEPLAHALRQWLAELAAGTAPDSSAMPRQSWAGCTEQLLQAILHDRWYRTWPEPPAADRPQAVADAA